MRNYVVPESIRKYKPTGTMVKAINGYYYVYEYKTVKDENGNRRTQMGKSIGTIKEGVGFVPNSNYSSDDEITSLEFGEYALVLQNSQKTLKLLMDYFNPLDALRIYCTAVIHFINGFTYLCDVSKYYEMSYLSLKYPGLKLGYTALSELYDSLGRRQGNVLKLEQALADNSSHEIAIDGHVVGCVSGENDLASKGYKFSKLGEEQINVLMAYDVNSEVPLLSRVYDGALSDSLSVKDLLNEVNFSSALFIVDRGFYSASNLELFSQNGNSYIIPIPNNNKLTKEAVKDTFMTNRFVYRKNKKSSTVEYKEFVYDNYRVLVFRDMNESAEEQTNYLRYIELGHESYTMERFNKIKDLLGVTVLQTSLFDKTPMEIYKLYKNRWKIETYYNYFKNTVDCNTLHLQDYYKTQGLSFIMLIEALIYREFKAAALNVKGKSVRECLLDARMLKIHKRAGCWRICNCKNSLKCLFQLLNTPLLVC